MRKHTKQRLTLGGSKLIKQTLLHGGNFRLARGGGRGLLGLKFESYRSRLRGYYGKILVMVVIAVLKAVSLPEGDIQQLQCSFDASIWIKPRRSLNPRYVDLYFKSKFKIVRTYSNSTTLKLIQIWRGMLIMSLRFN